MAKIKGKKLNLHKSLSALMAVIFVISAFMAATLAWTASQHRLNVAAGGEIEHTVTLQKVEVDQNGNVIEPNVPVAGALFALYRINRDGSETRVGGTFLTDVNGRHVVTGLAPGDYVFVEISPPAGWMFDVDENGESVTRYYFTIRENDVNVTVHAFNRRIPAPPGSLIVEKIVVWDSHPIVDQNVPFNFTVEFTGLPESPITITMNGVERQVSATDNIIDFVLYAGQRMVFEGIPAGVRYIVTEEHDDRFTTTSVDHQGQITSNGVSHVIYTNTARVGDLRISKEVVGGESDTEFTFIAIIGDREHIFTLRHGEYYVINGVLVGTPYTVREVPADGYTSAIREFSGVVTREDYVIRLPFVNVTEDENYPGSLEVTKIVPPNNDSDTEFEFIFVFEYEGEPLLGPIYFSIDGGAPQQLGADGIVLLRAGQTVRFDDLPFGTIVTITESYAEGYDANFDTAQVTIASNHVVEVEFINHPESEQEYGHLIIRKFAAEGQWLDEYFDPEQEFVFTVIVNGVALPDTVTLRAGEASAPITLPVGSHFVVIEAEAGDYIISGVVGGSGTIIVGYNYADFTNRFVGTPTTDIEGEKTWVNPDNITLPEFITVRVMDGERIVAEVQVRPNANGQWHFAFENLPKYDADGNEITYTIVEVPVDGWLASYCECCGNNITNTALPPYIASISVEKALAGGTPPPNAQFQFVLTGLYGAPMPSGVTGDTATITIVGQGVGVFSDITFRQAGTFVYNVHEVNTRQDRITYDTAVWTVTFVVGVNDQGELYVQSTTYERNGVAVDGSVALFTNIVEDDHTEIRVTKVWNDNNYANRPTSVQVQLLRNGVAYGPLVTLNAANNWTHLWTGLERGVVWTVYEPNVPAGYTKTISGDAVNGWVITNTRTGVPPTTQVSVNKVWDDNNNPNRPTYVQVQLRRNGVAHGELITLNVANNWQFTWTGLEVGPEWTVYEPNVPAGYTKSISGDSINGFTITNRIVPTAPPGTIILEGRKYWNHLNNPVQNRPTSITVFIYANGERLKSFLLTEDCHWRFSFELPRYDVNGNIIVYTVNEARVYDYTKRIDGWNIHNRFHPGTHTDRPYIPQEPDRTPQTGEDSMIAVWVSIMGLSMLGLVVTISLGIKSKRRLIHGEEYTYQGLYLK